MANARKASSPEEQEIIAGQAEIERLPKNFNERVKLLDNEKATRERMNDKIAQVKADAGLSEIERSLTESWGYTPQAIKITRILDGMPARSRAATIRQINLRAEDKAWILPDMFDQGSASAGSESAPAAEQRTPEQMAATHDATDEKVLTVAEAEEALKEHLELHPRKRGAKPAELVRLEKQLETARAHAGEPASNVVPIGRQMREGAQAGEEHIRKQIEEGKTAEAAKEGAKATAEQPSGEKPTPEKAPRKTRGKKAEETAPPASGPPAMDDDETEDEAPAAPAPPGGPIGTVPSSFRMG